MLKLWKGREGDERGTRERVLEGQGKAVLGLHDNVYQIDLTYDPFHTTDG
jgi:hypothetical protein